MATGQGQGTPAAVPSSVLAGDLITDAIRPALDDAGSAHFTDAELLSFLNEGIREYSQHLPRIDETTIVAVAQTSDYALPADCTAVLSVEYPLNQWPRTWLTYTRHARADFSIARDAYDYTQPNDADTTPTLILSFRPTAGEMLLVTYQRPHDHALTAADNITVPSEHHHVLIQYVMFAAARQLQAKEEANPSSPNSLLMSQYATNTRRYELIWLNGIQRILYQRRGKSARIAWEMDNYGRIY